MVGYCNKTLVVVETPSTPPRRANKVTQLQRSFRRLDSADLKSVLTKLKEVTHQIVKDRSSVIRRNQKAIGNKSWPRLGIRYCSLRFAASPPLSRKARGPSMGLVEFFCSAFVAASVRPPEVFVRPSPIKTYRRASLSGRPPTGLAFAVAFAVPCGRERNLNLRLGAVNDSKRNSLIAPENACDSLRLSFRRPFYVRLGEEVRHRVRRPGNRFRCDSFRRLRASACSSLSTLSPAIHPLAFTPPTVATLTELAAPSHHLAACMATCFRRGALI